MGNDREKNPDLRTSDMPGDLGAQREAFVRSFLKKGAELTEELLQENSGLKGELEQLRTDNARLRAQVASDDAIRDLIRTVESLEEEKSALLDRSSQLEASQQRGERRFETTERELHDLANLYVASFQLHTSLSTRRVVRHLLDMLEQLVGAHSAAIFVIDPGGKIARPIASERVEKSELGPVQVGEGYVGEACLTGIPMIRDSFSHETAGPTAVIPMIVDGRPVGAIAVYAMLAHKTRWESVDKELFNLLGAHAGNALIAANLYATAPGPVDSLGNLEENMRKRGASAPPADGEQERHG